MIKKTLTKLVPILCIALFTTSCYVETSAPVYASAGHSVPRGHTRVVISGVSYWHSGSSYYRYYPSRGYVSCAPPRGSKHYGVRHHSAPASRTSYVKSPPRGAKQVRVNNSNYWVANNQYYRHDSGKGYRQVSKPKAAPQPKPKAKPAPKPKAKPAPKPKSSTKKSSSYSSNRQDDRNRSDYRR
ncbi:DUF6515 family protein [Persicirhabdus sediminis]|uniref:Lipoprotein n=1 Tax=Persicirhabdus sediminis TaxID=454144 RepID=A0A8J7SIF4_9BACT|nr:DUF6515 family protein [Persicirhabdus sediminis]MBK1790406.1 hypothetical protein [Persicirhabdus sediminis]